MTIRFHGKETQHTINNDNLQGPNFNDGHHVRVRVLFRGPILFHDLCHGLPPFFWILALVRRPLEGCRGAASQEG